MIINNKKAFVLALNFKEKYSENLSVYIIYTIFKDYKVSRFNFSKVPVKCLNIEVNLDHLYIYIYPYSPFKSKF